jgi:hypothetical protein
MATAAVSAQGTQWQVKDSTFTAIPEVIRGDTPGVTTDTIDVTNHDSPQGVRENLPGFSDTDEVTWEGNFIPGNTIHEFLQAEQLAKTKPEFKVLLPGTVGNRVVTFAATIRTFRVSANVGEQLRWTMTLKPSGTIVWGTS